MTNKGLFIFLIHLIPFCVVGQDSYVLMVSFDGFRHDYAEKYGITSLKEMAANGASAEKMLPSFPSKTFPNHYSLVTGLYPGNHGLIDNSFFDPDLDILYRTRDRSIVSNPVFYGGWPLWQWLGTKGMKTGSFFWIGSEAPIKGTYPDYYKVYDHDFPNDARIDSVFQWFSREENERPRFVSLYFALVDDAGHSYGPEDSATGIALKEADRLIQRMREKIKKSGLPIDLIIVSDHGMYQLQPNAYIDITSYIPLPKDALRIVNSGSHMHIYANDPEFGEKFYTTLKDTSPDFTIYRKEEIPENWHYGQSSRIGDYFLMATAGNYFVRNKGDSPYGVHGYDPYTVPEMGAIFYAEGPSIKPGVLLPAFQNVDVFALICEILRVTTPEIDGDLTILGNALNTGN